MGNVCVNIDQSIIILIIFKQRFVARNKTEKWEKNIFILGYCENIDIWRNCGWRLKDSYSPFRKTENLISNNVYSNKMPEYLVNTERDICAAWFFGFI